MKNRTMSFNSRIKSATGSKRDSIYSKSTLESLRTDSNNKNSIADSLKFFVDNSETIKFFVEPKDKFKKYKFTRQSLFNSIYHQDKFNPEKEKRKLNKSLHRYFDYDVLSDKNKNNHKTCTIYFFLFKEKKIYLFSLVYKFGSLIHDLKTKCKDKNINSIEECEKIKFELVKNCEILTDRLIEKEKEFNFHVLEISEIKNDTDKIKRLNERIKCEFTYLNTEIPSIKEIISKVKLIYK